MIKKRNNYVIEEPPINLTPLIDVVFVVLIIFILIAPILEIDKISLAQNSQNEWKQTLKNQSPMLIQVKKDNSITFNQQKVNLVQLKELLKKAKNHYPKINPQLFQDKEAHFGIYQAIKNITEELGFEELDVILKPA
ncbi:biopolymer transport protein ExbD [Candidatus Rubidus massiliensis]|nr:MAG: hypothetical protein BGO10_02750 [Chlamydia sp. 32-24]CDZ79825.1 biopolymer transport protein ExbD [Candidatus Rubidus massiliensis]